MKKKKMSWCKKIILSLVLIIVLLLGGIVGYVNMSTMDATGSAVAISQSAKDEKDYLLFSNGQKNALSVIFYPGALVSPESYSVWAQEVAQSGYDVYIMKMPLNLAVLGKNKATEIISDHPKQKFVLAGHSLGGVMASRFVSEQKDQIVGMAFLASYPDKKGSLAESDLAVLSLTGSKDGVLNQEKYESSKAYLPKDTTIKVIEGGNHAGFGEYGKQKGDNPATITNEMQQKEISRHLTDWLIKLSM